MQLDRKQKQETGTRENRPPIFGPRGQAKDAQALCVDRNEVAPRDPIKAAAGLDVLQRDGRAKIKELEEHQGLRLQQIVVRLIDDDLLFPARMRLVLRLAHASTRHLWNDLLSPLARRSLHLPVV